jgi:hypothetical protein
MGDENIGCEAEPPKNWKENITGIIVDCSEVHLGNRFEFSFESNVGGIVRKGGFCSDREFTQEELKQLPEFRAVLTNETETKVRTAVGGR